MLPDQTPVDKEETTDDNKAVVGGKPGRGLFGRFAWTNPFILAFIVLFAVAGSYLLITSFASPDTPAKLSTTHVAEDTLAAPDQLLIQFKPGVPQATQDKLLARYQGKVKSDIPEVGVKVITVPQKARDAVITALAHNPAVQFAEKDSVVTPTVTIPNDPYYFGSPPATYSGDNAVKIYQWPFTTTQTNLLWDTTTGSPNTVVAVLDTGFLPSLADAGTFVSNWNVVNNNSDITPIDPHGVYTSGVVNAHSNNGVGVASTCWSCSVMGVRISTSVGGGAYLSDVAKGITYAADHGAKIGNISFAGTSPSSAVQSAEQYAYGKGMLIFAAAGNSGSNGNPVEYPAADPGVIGVAELAGSLASSFQGSSEHGSWVPIAAPGGVQTTLTSGGYGPIGGTSIASPFAAGVTALVWTAKPTATAAQIKQAIFSTTDPVTGGPTGYSVQYGRINAYKALQSLGSTTALPDTTAPTVSVSSPASGTTLAGQATVAVAASDSVGVAKVELYRNGTLYATSSAAPYNFYWDTTTSANGTYTLTAKAYDAAGNVSTSSAVSITVSNTTDTTAPQVTITAPAADASLSGNTVITANSSDNVGVVGVELYIDGLLRSSSTSAALSFTWNTGNETNGAHLLIAKVYDAAGNASSSQAVSVTVNNASDIVAPTATITSPASGSVVIGNLKIIGSAVDNVAVTKMEVYVDGSLKATSTTGSITYAWNTRKVSSGSHAIMVIAYDAAGNKDTVSEQVIKQ